MRHATAITTIIVAKTQMRKKRSFMRRMLMVGKWKYLFLRRLRCKRGKDFGKIIGLRPMPWRRFMSRLRKMINPLRKVAYKYMLTKGVIFVEDMLQCLKKQGVLKMTKPELLLILLPLKALLEKGESEKALEILVEVIEEVRTKPESK